MNRMTPSFQVHTIEPVYDADSRILILGSFPSIKSREANFFYGHPQNRYWKMMAAIYGEEELMSVEEKKTFLRKHHIAMWDSIHSCTITGSSDSSIKDVVPNDFSRILDTADIRQIFCNGTASYHVYVKYVLPRTGREARKMPSTSPANAAWSLEKLISSWQVVRNYTG
ncbi:MAG: DNA-deoxyinosine glycosylase [Eubacterium sp.]|nr:DNA-deoxyinosine glycosylase [Eubacterium sp.]